MYKKLRFKILALSCIFSISLILGTTSDGFCGGASPPLNIILPKVDGILVVNSNDIMFVGVCKKKGEDDQFIEFTTPNILGDISNAKKDDLVGISSSLFGFGSWPVCTEAEGVIITKVKKFYNISASGGNAIVAEIELKHFRLVP